MPSTSTHINSNLRTEMRGAAGLRIHLLLDEVSGVPKGRQRPHLGGGGLRRASTNPDFFPSLSFQKERERKRERGGGGPMEATTAHVRSPTTSKHTGDLAAEVVASTRAPPSLCSLFFKF
ncbi:hypothetical protein CRG98_020000 [Punica granatum]|uniref:Uncharacterized protein n=1 Tax=Punica granatum TaxID=22663 RepID=A0A2I0JTJ3_PUNGR|nr:hypothetical protein CRG98_020000 [Punica granatum]